MSLFRRKKSSKQLHSADSSPLPRSSSGSFLSSSQRSTPHSTPPTLHVDDFGRPVDRPAFSTQSLNRSPRDLGAPFGFGVGEDGQSTSGGTAQEMQLLYGYAPLATTLGFGITKVEDIVSKCAIEIRQRGISIPSLLVLKALIDWEDRSRYTLDHVEYGIGYLVGRSLFPHQILPRRFENLGIR